ncbi:4Fe-4S dicluster domain-containing protein [Natronincola ferrireducens]|uniref:Fe-S-cluster-containing hydrogenase component 2 n=1 Tax=Natronincola ferrireducens TaxID=393762 RepID=A0A1G8Z1C3_9FIRM|nr:4Fe-4S dicluster domain-containing protein [Natronincola ferrireducens]SDK08050.1 Fe-S-cluster-containing hydrogenase component 2 [Natronincola ferrireducens]
MATKMVGIKEKCVGCRICELACSINLEGVFNPKLSKIQIERGKGALDLPHVCYQCEKAACSQVCPVDAIEMEEDTGIWRLDKEACIGCGTCIDACPYGAIFMEPNNRYAIKCEICEDLHCKESCPNGALELQK